MRRVEHPPYPGTHLYYSGPDLHRPPARADYATRLARLMQFFADKSRAVPRNPQRRDPFRPYHETRPLPLPRRRASLRRMLASRRLSQQPCGLRHDGALRAAFGDSVLWKESASLRDLLRIGCEVALLRVASQPADRALQSAAVVAAGLASRFPRGKREGVCGQECAGRTEGTH